MEFFQEFRNLRLVKTLVDEINRITTKPWVIMEICGGQTHAIMQYGIDQLLPPRIELVHGPGCPVCVTSLELIDKSHAIAAQPGVIFASFGDMLRVPGSKNDLFSLRASGSDVRVVYSPLDAVKIAQENPDKQVVFFAIGFETTAPANAMCVLLAKSLNLNNFSLLVSHVRVPPAIDVILSSPYNQVQGILAAGHVCTVMGYWEYLPLSQKYQSPIVVTGFEPLDILQGIYMTVRQLENNQSIVENAYGRVVTQNGNRSAQAVINQVFQTCDRKWRGIGLIENSGWRLKPEFDYYDAEKRFSVEQISPEESTVCIAGLILQGLKKPLQCPAFGIQCTPEHPLGATMVSSEGACSAYYRYQRIDNY
ncbi:MAG: hydrogenase formation protein HypD [Chloroflexi bacterium]|nr:hydrogenase formation protein HypD [Chloroflexota bacterium]